MNTTNSTTEKVETQQEKSKTQQAESQLQSNQFYDEGALNRPRLKKDKYSLLSIQLNLPTPQRKGYVRQWVIDKEKRVFEARDWKPVKGEDGNLMRQVMNHRTKEPEFGTYMEIPEIYFQENLRADDAIRKDLVEKRINNKDVVHEVAAGSGNGSGKIDGNNFYTPDAKANGLKTN